MSHPISFRTIPWLAVLAAVFLVPVMAKSPSRKNAKKDPQLQLRLVCATSLEENQQVVLASRDAEGKWQELATVGLRAALITDWLPARAGELHLAKREGGTLKSICKFDYPADSRRVLAALVADAENKTYESHVVDPASKGFVQGSTLIFNFSPHAAVVTLGSKEEKVEAGKESVAKPDLEGSGMYRLMVSYTDDGGKTVPCYDRQVPGNPKSRDMLFLMPDKSLGLRVMSVPVFGALD